MKALITGISGQDGSYLAEFLLRKGYEVFGLVRRASLEKYDRIAHMLDSIVFLHGDLTDQGSLETAMQIAQPDEVYNLASQSYVAISWTQPMVTADVTGLGVFRVLEALRKYAPKAKFFQASSSEMFGKSDEQRQNECSRFHPRSPYGIAKTFGHHVTINYRESYGIFACSGICFNHESPRRGPEFISRKVTQYIARVKNGHDAKLKVGNIDARRDWGFAGDYVPAMWMMLQQREPQDFVIATGETHSVRELLELAFRYAGLNWQEHVDVDAAFLRLADVDYLCGDASKARQTLGWRPNVTFRGLMEMMVDADLAACEIDKQVTAYKPRSDTPFLLHANGDR